MKETYERTAQQQKPQKQNQWTRKKEIDYTAGLKFADGFGGARDTCVEFDGLQEDSFYRFQVIGGNDAGYSAASRWSIVGKTRRMISSILGDDCGCGVWVRHCWILPLSAEKSQLNF
eukprot:TRINITY_DN14223_c1_g1_i7.p3 TRINITY_DN14223_c1_g1~~TRINITY_DN14223_c1_g1_i7.p3  ORF type:complete len:117 (-),score=15.18 TRINITY_DN14223_c1_g1_i7:4-354(-)